MPENLKPQLEGEGEGEGGEELAHSPHCLFTDHNKGLPAKSVTLSTPTEPLCLVSVSSWPSRGTSVGCLLFSYPNPDEGLEILFLSWRACHHLWPLNVELGVRETGEGQGAAQEWGEASGKVGSPRGETALA
jgi:hypothetical protein